METIRYTGEDIAIDIVLKDDEDVIIDPTGLQAIYIYVIDQSGTAVAKYAEPEKAEYQALNVTAEKIRLWLQSDLTADLAGKKLHLELNIEEANEDLTDQKQNLIALSDVIIIKPAAVGDESNPEEPEP